MKVTVFACRQHVCREGRWWTLKRGWGWVEERVEAQSTMPGWPIQSRPRSRIRMEQTPDDMHHYPVDRSSKREGTNEHRRSGEFKGKRLGSTGVKKGEKCSVHLTGNIMGCQKDEKQHISCPLVASGKHNNDNIFGVPKICLKFTGIHDEML